MTEQAGHTLGRESWRVLPPDSVARAPAILDIDGFYVASIHGAMGQQEKALKRAQLMAAAPDLLEALQEIAKTDLAQVNGYAQGWVKALIKTANGAILKATKEQT